MWKKILYIKNDIVFFVVLSVVVRFIGKLPLFDNNFLMNVVKNIVSIYLVFKIFKILLFVFDSKQSINKKDSVKLSSTEIIIILAVIILSIFMPTLLIYLLFT